MSESFRPVCRGAMHALAWLASALSLSACSIPGPETPPDQMAGLERARLALTRPPGIEMSYLRAGDPAGRRVIFVHGTPGDATAWADYLMHVPPGFEFIAIDRPGFGESGPDIAVTSLADQAAAIEPLLVERDGHWPVLVGHSLGGPIIAQAAADYPGRVGALIQVAGSLDPALEDLHILQPMGEWPPFVWLLPRVLRNTNREILALEPQLEALAPRLADIAVPVIVVHGTKDDLVPFANVAFMQAHFTGTTVETDVLEGLNHFLPWNSKPAIDDAIRRAAERS